MYWCTILIINTIVHTHKRTMITLLAASFDQGIESFHFSMRMRRATSRRNALTSSPVRAASDTYIQSALRVTVHRIYSTIPVYNLISVSSSRGCIIVLVIDTVVVVVVVVQCFPLVRVLIILFTRFLFAFHRATHWWLWQAYMLFSSWHLCRGYMRNKIISAFVDVPTEIILPKIISKLFQRLIAVQEYF